MLWVLRFPILFFHLRHREVTVAPVYGEQVRRFTCEMVTRRVGAERGNLALVLASLIVFSRFLVVRPALRPQQEAVGHIEESIQVN